MLVSNLAHPSYLGICYTKSSLQHSTILSPASRVLGALLLCRQCVSYCRAGHTLRQLHHLSIGLLSEGMAALGLCGRMSAAAISQTVYSMFYPHSVGEQPPFLEVPTYCALVCKHLHMTAWYLLLFVTSSLYCLVTKGGCASSCRGRSAQWLGLWNSG